MAQQRQHAALGRTRLIDARLLRRGLSGRIVTASDKSVTHRAVMFAAMNHGTTIIRRPLRSDDCLSSLRLIVSLGATVHVDPVADEWLISRRMSGVAIEATIDCGNSGTTARLGAGLLACERGGFTLVGDPSLSVRPMERVAEPLRRLGARITTSDGALPMQIVANGAIAGDASNCIDVASAQVHGALTLAGIRSRSGARLQRTRPMRDHTLRMAKHFGVEIHTTSVDGSVIDQILPAIINRDIVVDVPGDFSSAAFFIAAAVLAPGSEIIIDGLGLNPTRIAFLNALIEMGAEIEVESDGSSFEPRGQVHVRYSDQLSPIQRGVGQVEEMLDELPLLALVATRANGRSVISGAGELRVKESDRIGATARLLARLGVEIDERPDGFEVVGPQRVVGGGVVDHCGDHRICMMASVAGLIAENPIFITDPEIVGVSYPDFWRDLESLGATITEESDGD